MVSGDGESAQQPPSSYTDGRVARMTTQHTNCPGFRTGSPMSWDIPLVLGTWGQLVTLCTLQRVAATSFAHPETRTQGPRQMANQALGSWPCKCHCPSGWLWPPIFA